MTNYIQASLHMKDSPKSRPPPSETTHRVPYDTEFNAGSITHNNRSLPELSTLLFLSLLAFLPFLILLFHFLRV